MGRTSLFFVMMHCVDSMLLVLHTLLTVRGLCSLFMLHCVDSISITYSADCEGTLFMLHCVDSISITYSADCEGTLFFVYAALCRQY